MIKIALGMLLVLGSWLPGTIWAAPTIEHRLKQLAPYEVKDVRVNQMSNRKKTMLRHLIHAAWIMDSIYLKQMNPQAQGWMHRLENLARQNKKWEGYRKYFSLAYGPWDIFFEDWYLPVEAFPEQPKKVGKNYYPDGLTQTEIEKWIENHPLEEAKFRSPYTMIRNSASGGLQAIPYAQFFASELGEAAQHLEAARELARDSNLKKLLTSRVEAFRTDHYNETEKDWIKAWNSEVQLTIGPYEEYDDTLLGLKRGFGARVALKDQAATQNLQEYLSYIDEFQKRLPMHANHLKDRRKASFITAVNEILMTGESRAGVQTLAHKLPNDRSVTLKHGSRRVLFMNILEGKCQNILKPIAKVVLTKALAKRVSCDSFKKFTLHHEIAHALGPAFYYENIEKRKGRRKIQERLGVWGSPVEEAKADIVGLLDRQYMFEKGMEPKPREMEMYATYLAGIFRTVRFGAGSAHKKGIMLQFNMLRKKGAIFFDPQGRVGFNLKRMKMAVPEVVRFVLSLQTEGSAKKAQDALEKYGVVPSEMQKLLDRVSQQEIPRDLYPIFPSAQALLSAEN